MHCINVLFLTPFIKSEFKMRVRSVDVAMCGLQMGFGNCHTRSGNFTYNLQLIMIKHNAVCAALKGV